MRVMNEIIIRGAQTSLERLLMRTEALLRDGWKRNRQAEERLGRHGTRGPWDYCFSCTAAGDRPAAGLWVHARGLDELHISSVVPLEKQKLTEEESNRLLAEFEREYLRPAAAEVGAETALVQRRMTLEHELSPGASQLLRTFSFSAKRAELRSDDRKRWNAFLIRVHQDDSIFDLKLLDEWLEQEGWPQDVRVQLLGQFEAAQALLSDYDEEVEHR
jgi:hypothetical protein